ncbi:MAG TPA: flavin reductase family protein [Trebonia sp.]|jgi:flavin reductase (DIM6/NTAB) family NADH-FMN oxidoreductase RutF
MTSLPVPGPSLPGEVRADHASMRETMGAFPSGVTVLATCVGTVPVGMTISSFASVSLEPPLLLQCVSRAASCLPAFRVRQPVAVNVLAHDQARLARRFAGKDDDRFAGIDFHLDGGGSPVLAGTAAWIGGAIDRIYDAGDHVILLIRARTVHRTGKMPLLYHSGQIHDWTTAVA